MVFKEIMLTVEQLIERELYHNDIKPGNICYEMKNDEINIFLIDLDSIDFRIRTGCVKTPSFSPCKNIIFRLH